MGEVYRASDNELGREVAIMVLAEDLSRDKQRLNRLNEGPVATTVEKIVA